VDTDDVVSEPNVDVARPKRLRRGARIAAGVAIVLVVVGAVILVVAQPWNRAEPVASSSATQSTGVTPTKTTTATPSPTASAHVIGTVTAGPDLPPAKPLESGLLASAGEGWSLVRYGGTQSVEPSTEGPQILYLVSPDGDVYEVRNLGTGGDLRLADWAPGSSLVLILRGPSQGRNGFGTAEVLDLETGASVGSFTLPPGVGAMSATFTHPTGQNVVVSAARGANGWLKRYSPTGQELANLLSATDPNLPPDEIINFNPTWIYGPDGTFAVVSHNGLSRVSADGSTTTPIPLPAGTLECWPTRWWDASHLLVRCDDDLGPNPDDPTARRTSSNMWLISMTGQAPERLSSYVSKDVVDFGITNVWDVAGTRYAQWSGDCGGASFGVLDASGKYTTLTNSVTAVGHRGATFAAKYSTNCGDPGSELVFVNGSDGSTRMILPRVGHGMGVLEVVAR
jgi:hypothetical protein